jgi:hypothetical protein
MTKKSKVDLVKEAKTGSIHVYNNVPYVVEKLTKKHIRNFDNCAKCDLFNPKSYQSIFYVRCFHPHACYLPRTKYYKKIEGGI